jgi:hypothetical protein
MYQFKEVPRHVEVQMDDGSNIQLSGIFGQLATYSSITADGVGCNGEYDIDVLPDLPDVWSKAEFGKWLVAVNRIIAKQEKLGYLPLPTKVNTSDGKVNQMLFVHRTSPLGVALEKLTPAQRKALYENWASICQYGNQPFDRYVKGVEVRTIDEGMVRTELSEFKSCLEKEMSEEEVARFLENHKESVEVPFGDGQMYARGDSPIWDLSPEEIRAIKRNKITAMKVIGRLKSSPFVFLKGVLVKLSKKEWAKKCDAAGISVDYDGIIVNTHSIKNKLDLKLNTKKLSFNIGYHNDNRQFEGKTQIWGPQANNRSGNIKDHSLYFNAVSNVMDDIHSSVKECDLPQLVSSLSGVSKVVEGTPFYGVVLKLLAVGLPVSYINNVEEDITRMVVKRLGRPKIKLSTRTLPKCSEGIGLTDIALTRDQARRLDVKTGDSIVLLRSPKAAGFPALVLKVINTSAACCALNATLYAYFNQGDFDGDTIALYKNEGIVECESSIVEVLDVLFEDNSKIEMCKDMYESAASNTEGIEKAQLDKLHPGIGPIYQMIRAKAATGPYDNYVTRLQNAGASDEGLRAYWNTVVQAAITNMKHVGASLAGPLELHNAHSELGIKLPKLTSFHYLLTGNHDRYLEADVHDKSPLAERVVGKMKTLDFASMKAKNVKYGEMFGEVTLNKLYEAVEWTYEYHPEIAHAIFNLSNEGKMQWITSRKTGQPLYLALSPEVDAILNPPRGHGLTSTFRFNQLRELIDELVESDDEKLTIAWKLIYVIGLVEPFKRWLLKNTINDDISAAVSTMIGRIGAECGFKQVNVEE